MTTEDEETLDKKEDDFTPPKDGSWLPKVRVDEMVGTAKDAAREANEALKVERQRNADLQAKMDTTIQPNKSYTRTDLAQLVESEQLTQVQADQLWDKQLEERFEKRLDQKLNETINTSNINSRIDGDLSQYKAVIPDLMEAGENRTKVENEYKYLLSIGHPDSKITELAAVRSVFGSLDKLKQSKATLDLETHQETGGTQSDSQKGTSFEDTLTARQKVHYEKGIEMGLYKNWKEVEEEMKFSVK